MVRMERNCKFLFAEALHRHRHKQLETDSTDSDAERLQVPLNSFVGSASDFP